MRTRTYTNVLQGEELDPVIGSIPGEKESVAVEVTQLLTSTYKIKEEDLVSAELALVPASHPADVGFDRGLDRRPMGRMIAFLPIAPRAPSSISRARRNSLRWLIFPTSRKSAP